MLQRNAWRRATAPVALTACVVAGCSHAWDDFDPRLGASTSSAGATGGSTTSSATSTTGEGGATTASSSSATGGGETSTTGSGGEAPTCPANGTSTLTDDFDAAEIDVHWYDFAGGSATLAQTGGELVMTLGSSAGGSFFAGVTSKGSFDLTGCQALVEVTAVPDPSTYALGALQIVIDLDDTIELAVNRGALEFKVNTAATLSFYEDIPYDAQAHRWWRIREERGFILYETSPDGAAWTVQSSVVNTHDVTSVYIGLVGGIYSAAPTAPGEMKLDNLNLAP